MQDQKSTALLSSLAFITSGQGSNLDGNLCEDSSGAEENWIYGIVNSTYHSTISTTKRDYGKESRQNN
jgi:hypothetical protein